MAVFGSVPKLATCILRGLSLSIYILLSFSGVLAKEANTTLVDFPNDFYCDWPKQNVTITHRAGTTWPKAKLKKVWNGFVNKGIKIIQENLKPKI